MSYDCRDPIMYAAKELELSGFSETDFGKAALEYVTQVYKLAQNDIQLVRQIHANITGMVDLNPLAPLQEDEMEEQETLEYYNGAMIKTTRRQHKRCPWVYEQDGKYWDDRAIAFKNIDGGVWYGANGEYRSKREITFPYYRREELVLVDPNKTPEYGNKAGTPGY